MAISPANQDIDYYSGSEIGKSYTVTDADGNAVDLSGATLEIQVKRRATDPLSKVLAFFKTEDDTITISGAGNNVVTLHGVHQMDQDIYYQDLFWEEEDDYIWEGKFLVVGNVTRKT